MWKIAAAFAVLAGLALFVLSKGGGNVDLGGEKHDLGVTEQPAPAVMVAPATSSASGASAASAAAAN